MTQDKKSHPDPLDIGRESAQENLAHEQPVEQDTKSAEANIEAARETAKENYKHDDQDDVHEQGSLRDGTAEFEGTIEKNNTSKSAKIETAKSQLNPAGDEPISDADIRRSATEANMESASGTTVSNADAADPSRVDDPELQRENTISGAAASSDIQADKN